MVLFKNWDDPKFYLANDDDPDAPDFIDFPHYTAAARPPVAVPYRYAPSETLPPRQWVMYGVTLKGYLTTTVAAGGTGKTTLLMAEAASVATGLPIMGIKPKEVGNVLLFNGEDPRDEIELRMAALIEYHSQLHPFSSDALNGKIFIQSGRDTDVFMLTTQERGVTIVVPHREEDLIAFIKANQIILVVVDPFVSVHNSSENDNGAINTVARVWAKIANDAGCAVHLAHHAKKGGSPNAPEESSRGASALMDASRVTRVLTVMSVKEAEDYGINPDQHYSYVKITSGKVNLSKRSGAPNWMRLIGVPLGNNEEVQTCEPWYPPAPFEDVTVADLVKLQQAVQEAYDIGVPLRLSPIAGDFAGHTIKALLLSGSQSPDPDKDAKKLLNHWIANGALKVEEYFDKRASRKSKIVVVGNRASLTVDVWK